MNKIVVSLGMAALGVSGIQVTSAQEAIPSKLWNVTASLRGFYDDNINTAPSADKVDSYGWEVSPGLGLNWEADATKVHLAYRYGLKYYEIKPAGNTDKYDQTHTFEGVLDHAINERFRFNVTDSFVIGQEPDALRNGTFATAQRISGNNIRNFGAITFDAQITRLFNLELGYDNAFFDYADDFSSTPGGKNVDAFGNITPSNSGALDRIQNGGTVEGQFLVAPETKALVGFKFQETDYTADEPIAGIYPTDYVTSDSRNRRSYIGYLGLDHSFSPDLSGSIRGGVQYNDYYNDDKNTSGYNPYVQASGRYLYAPESFVELGFNQTRSATDVTGGTNVVRDADISLLYGSIHHRITPKIYGSVLGTFQNSIYNGGGSGIDGKSQQYYSVGVNLQYRFNPFLSTEVGYNYDNVQSDVTSDYNRNRVYIGLTAAY
jgi:hypothetical protein